VVKVRRKGKGLGKRDTLAAMKLFPILMQKTHLWNINIIKINQKTASLSQGSGFAISKSY